MAPDRAVTDRGSTATVFSLVANTANQRLLTRWLAENSRYQLVEGELDSASFDICVLDTAALRQSQSTLRRRKDEADSLLPYLLLVPDSSWVAVNEELRRQHPALWELVDGTVRVPLDKYDLANSIDTLLRLRDQSQEISRRGRQLEILNRLLRHDIRNDIAVVLGWLDVLSDSITPEQRSAYERIESASNHILDLTTTARDITETIASGGEPELRPMNLTQVVLEEAEKCRTTFETASIELPDSPPEITVAANDLLSSVFRNLISNAVQHNDAAEPRVAISLSASDGAARVKIADNGPGIPDSIREQIFHDEVKGVESAGSGMGLYLVSTLVQMYDGSVWVDDNDPRGSVFVVELPTVEAAD
ncbi:sensor histidine kinase [Halolamina sp. C58]|uniref:sensor histidine kinase n=1 Tax=Halolamina sp. C58 TaxID=3421640 RepID=UPI003EBB5D03